MTANIKKMGIVSRDYRKLEKNGFRDFCYSFESILKVLNEQNCDSVLFSLFTIDKGSSFDVMNILNGLNLDSIKTVFIEEYEDGDERKHEEYVIYSNDKDQWKEQRFTQKFAKGGVKEKVAKSFKIEVQEERLFANYAVLLCGEINIVNYKMHSKKIEDTHAFCEVLDRDIEIILNPIHDRMTRFEMKLKRKFLSKNNRWVISVWNKGKSNSSGEVLNYKTPDWTIFYNEEELEIKPIDCEIESQVDIKIGILDLNNQNK
jgi:hypothetical protein